MSTNFLMQGKSEKIKEVSSLANDLDTFRRALSSRLSTLNKLANKIEQFEVAIGNINPENLSLQTQLEYYRVLAGVHISYIETLRRGLSGLDMEKMFKMVGLMQILEKFEKLSPEGVEKVQYFLGRVGDATDDKFR